MWDEFLDYSINTKSYPNDFADDYGFKSLSYYEFLEKIIENTLSHKWKWCPVFEENIMWDKVEEQYIFAEPKIRCKVGRRYLYAELSDGIYDVECEKKIKSINNLYSIIDGEKKSYYLSDCQEEDMFNLYKAIDTVNEAFFRLFKRERAIRRINLLNKFYDLISQSNEECIIDTMDKTCLYKNNFILCRDSRIYVSYRTKKGCKYFQLYAEEIQKVIKDAYGDIAVSANDLRFQKLLGEWYFVGK